MKSSSHLSSYHMPSVSQTRDFQAIELANARTPHFNRKEFFTEKSSKYAVPETWFEPNEDRNGSVRFVQCEPGCDYVHAVTVPEIKDFLCRLPAELVEKISRSLDVIKLSGRSRKNETQNLYGLQWGSAVYLYPYNSSLSETFVHAPSVVDRIQTERYGGRWFQTSENEFQLTWSRDSLRDFYLCEVLMHEIGHVLDNRNTKYREREQFADAFATEYGYLPWKAMHPMRPVRRRHH